MDLKIHRLDKTQQGIFGELIVSNQRFKTVERLYRDNQPFISSVPAGVYTLEPHSSDKHRETWALVNESIGVYHWDNPKAKRYAILIHVANRARQLAGCVGVGKNLGFIKDEIAVTSSRIAVGEVLKLLSRDTTHTLEIIDKT